MQYFNSKSNKKSEKVNILGDDENILSSIDMFNFDKVKNETSFTEKKTAHKAESDKENIYEEENLENNEDEDIEEETNQWTKNMVTEKLNQLEVEKSDMPFKNAEFSEFRKNEDDSLTDTLNDFSGQMYTSYKLNDAENSINISEDELNIKDSFVDNISPNEEDKSGKFFEELDNDAISLGIYDTNDYYDFNMNNIDEGELYREGLADDSMSVGGENLYIDEEDSVNLNLEEQNSLYKEEPTKMEKEFIESNELDFENTEFEDFVSDEELKQFSLELEEEFFETEVKNELEIEFDANPSEENPLDDKELSLLVEESLLYEELNFIEKYCKEHGFPVTDNEKDLTKFLSKSNLGEISKIKTIVDGKEFFYISSIIAKILYTESILLLEKNRETALNLLEGICLYCVDLEVSTLALLKLKEMLEMDNNIARLKILINNMCEKEQELLKVIYWF